MFDLRTKDLAEIGIVAVGSAIWSFFGWQWAAIWVGACLLIAAFIRVASE